MTDNGNQKRPVRTLEVENFSVIKKARLEFGRITVLIGPQASGKSLLCKLAYFLGGEIVEIAVESLMERGSWAEFLKRVEREFQTRFSTKGWLKKSAHLVVFQSHKYLVRLAALGDQLNPRIEFTFSGEFERLYIAINSNQSKQLSSANMTPSERQALRQDLWVEISLLLNEERTQTNIYIPSGRAFFTDLGKALSTLQKSDLDQITRRFAGQITWDSRWKVGLLTTDRDVVPKIEMEMQRIAGGVATVVDDRPLFLSFDGRSLPLSQLSSGTLELLPMFNVLSRQAFELEHIYARAGSRLVSPLADISEHSPLIYLEEPEAHVFPDTQRELVNLFAWMTNDPILSFDWVITTHSPYILTAFNTLIEAWRAAKKTGKRDAVAAIVPWQSWIDENDFAAYTIQDGVLKPIFEKERKGVEGSGLIDGDYLDDVSDTIANQFSRLLEIEFADAT